MFIHTANHVGNSRVTPLVMEGMNELVQDGQALRPGLEIPVHRDDSAIYAVSDDGDDIGVICFRPKGVSLEVTLGYVEPSSRRAKVMTRLWKELMKYAAEHHHRHVFVSATVNNEAGTNFLKKIGGQPDVVVYSVTT